MMVGMSMVLEGEGEGEGEVLTVEPCRGGRNQNSIVEVISKINNKSMLINCLVAGSSYSSTPSSSPGFRSGFPIANFLDQCFLCRTKLSPGKDIYMYRGDMGFCSEECRCKYMLLEEEEEEEAFRRENQKQKQNQSKSQSNHCSSSAHPSPSSRNVRRGIRNTASGRGVSS